MNTRRLQRLLDQLLATTTQRLLLVALAVGTVVVASASLAKSTSLADTWVVFVVAVLALVGAVEPDEHLATIVMAIVVFHWLVLDQDTASPWSLAIGASLFIFHTLVALMAVTPHTSVIGRTVLVRWLTRSIVPAVAMIGTWLLVVAFERRDSPGNVALSTAALAVLAAAVVTFRVRTTGVSADANGDHADHHDAQPGHLLP